MASYFFAKKLSKKQVLAGVLLAMISAFAFSLDVTGKVASPLEIGLAAKDVLFQLLAFLACLSLYLLALSAGNRRLYAFSAPLGFLAALAYLLGLSSRSLNGPLGGEALPPFSLLYYSGLILGWALFFTAIFMLLLAGASFFVSQKALLKPHQKRPALWRIWHAGKKQTVWAVFLLLILCWLPYYIFLFPGALTPDTASQIKMGLGLNPYTAHHPPLISWVLGLFLQMGQALFGSYYAGYALLTSLQYLAAAASLSYALYAMAGFGIGPVFRLITLCYFALSPSIANSALTCLKDYWQGYAALLFLIFLIRLCLQKQAFFGRLLPPLLLFGFALLTILFKKTGMVYIGFATLAALPLLSRCRLKGVAVLGAALLAGGLIQGPLYSTMGIAAGDMGEALSIPSLQMARVVRYHGAELGEAEVQMLAAILPYEALPGLYDATLMRADGEAQQAQREKAAQVVASGQTTALYDATLMRVADSVKNTLNSDVFRNDLPGYLRLWAELGLRYPAEYAKAFLIQSSGYWFPGSRAPQLYLVPYDLYVQRMDSSFDPMAADYSPLFNPTLPEYPLFAFVAYALASLPLISVLFSIGFQFWVLLFCCVWLLYRKNYPPLAFFALPFAVFASCILSPVNNHFRYAFPALLALPLLVGFVFSRNTLGRYNQPSQASPACNGPGAEAPI